jgi:excisionase family DNA binding protein
MARIRENGGVPARQDEAPRNVPKEHPDSLSSLPAVLTLGEVAAVMRVHVNSLYPLVLGGVLPAFKVRSRWRVTRAALIQFMGGAHE